MKKRENEIDIVVKEAIENKAKSPYEYERDAIINKMFEILYSDKLWKYKGIK